VIHGFRKEAPTILYRFGLTDAILCVDQSNPEVGGGFRGYDRLGQSIPLCRLDHVARRRIARDA
jgi:hypothetical protein